MSGRNGQSSLLIEGRRSNMQCTWRAENAERVVTRVWRQRPPKRRDRQHARDVLPYGWRPHVERVEASVDAHPLPIGP